MSSNENIVFQIPKPSSKGFSNFSVIFWSRDEIKQAAIVWVVLVRVNRFDHVRHFDVGQIILNCHLSIS